MTRRERTPSSISRHLCRSSSLTGRYAPCTESRVFSAFSSNQAAAFLHSVRVITCQDQALEPWVYSRATVVVQDGSRRNVRHTANPCRRSASELAPAKVHEYPRTYLPGTQPFFAFVEFPGVDILGALVRSFHMMLLAPLCAYDPRTWLVSHGKLDAAAGSTALKGHTGKRSSH